MKNVLAILIIPFAVVVAFAFSLNVDPTQTGSFLCGSTASPPTQIFNNDLSAMRTYIVNTSSNNVFIVGYSTSSALSISSAAAVSTSLTTGSFYIAAGTNTFANNATPTIFTTWSPDGPIDPYRGPLWCVGGGNGAVVQRYRSH